MRTTFTVAEAAEALGLPQSHLRGWMQRAIFDLGRRLTNRTIEFSLADVRTMALMRELTSYGLSPNIAAKQAATIVERAAEWPLVAVFSRDPKVSPCLVPQDAMPDTPALIVIPLAPLWAKLSKPSKGRAC